MGYLGHVLVENRHGLIVDAMLTQADGAAERGAALLMSYRQWRHMSGLDKNGKLYKVAGLVPQEMLSNDVEDGIPQHPSIFDPPIWFQFVNIYPGYPEKNTNAAGIFSDTPFGTWHSGNTVHTASDTQ